MIGVNKAIKQFIEDFKLIVLPLTLDGTFKKADLEDVALALYSKNPDELGQKESETLRREIS